MPKMVGSGDKDCYEEAQKNWHEQHIKDAEVDEDWVMEDDGDHMTYKGGCDRQSTKGKGRYDLISPVFLRRLAIVLEKGAEKYEERNWEKGMPLSRCLDSAMRHISQLLDGQDDEDHAGHAACNLMFYIHLRERVLAGNLDEKWDDLPRERNLSGVPEKESL